MLNFIWTVCRNLTLVCALLLLLLVAIYSASGRYIIANIDQYRATLEDTLTEELGVPVLIQSLSGEWHVFDPILHISELSIGSEQTIFLGQASFRLSFVRSLIARAPRFRSISFIRPFLSIEQYANGAWKIRGLPALQSNDSALDLAPLAELISDSDIVVHSAALQTKDPEGRETHWLIPKGSLSYIDDQLHANGEVLQPGGKKALAQFAYVGQLLPELAGNVYLEFRSLDYFGDLIKTYRWNDIYVRNVEAAGRLWFTFNRSAINSVHAELQVKSLNWTIADVDQEPITDLAAAISWASADGLHAVQLNQLGFVWRDHTLPKTNVDMLFGNDLLLVQADQVDVGLVSELVVQSGFANEKLQERLIKSEPEGFMKNVYFQTVLSEADEHGMAEHIRHEFTTLEPRETPSFVLKSNLSELSSKAFRGAPGGSGISGYVEASGGEGRVLLQSTNFSMDFPKLFLEGWSFEQTNAVIGWDVKGENALVFSEGIQFDLGDGQLVFGDFETSINPIEEEDYLKLKIGLQDIPMSSATRFVPYYAVEQNLYEWLDSSLKSGMVGSGKVALFGSTEKNQAKNSFTTSLQLAVSEGVVVYDPEWPPLESLDAQIDLQESQLDVVASRASIRGSVLTDLNARLPAAQVDRKSILKVSAQSVLSPEDIDYWLGESPLAETTEVVAQELNFKGSLSLGLGLNIHFEPTTSVGYEVLANLDGMELSYGKANLDLSQLKGSLSVSDSDGLIADDLSAVLLGETIDIDISSFVEHDVFRSTEINFKGNYPLSTWLSHYDIEAIPAVDGASSWSASLSLPISLADQKNSSPRLQVKSDLSGIAVDWPEPLYKSIEQASALAVDIWFADETRIEGQWSEYLSFETTLIDNQHAGTHVYLGQDLPWPREDSGESLSVFGQAVGANLEDWIGFVSTHFTGGPGESSLLEKVDVSIGEVDAYGQIFEDVDLLLTERDDRWRALVGGETISGEVTLPDDDVPLELKFEHLTITRETTENHRGDASDVLPDPREIPELIFDVERLTYNDKDYGSWSAQTETTDQGVIFRAIESTIGDTNIQAQLNWQALESGDLSILTADLKGKDADRFLKQFGYPDIVNSKNFTMALSLVWPDSPEAFATEKLSGKIQFKLKNGRVNKGKDADPLKLLGVLNADTLKRRLQLDFSDLYESGITFDDMNASASIDQGNLLLTDPLIIKGPSSNFVFLGETNLASETLDMKMTVELPIMQNVPLAALALGAPTVGGAVWLVDKLLGEPLSGLSSVRYRLSGTWDEPVLTPLRLPENFSAKPGSSDSPGA